MGNKYGYQTLEGLKKTMKGVIMVDGHWAKICVEYKVQCKPHGSITAKFQCGKDK